MNLHDAIRQAREANVEAGRRLLTMTPEDRATVRALGELIVALDDTLPHLVDTRQLSEVVLRGRAFSITRDESGGWTVVHADGDEICVFMTLQRAMEEATAAAAAEWEEPS